MNMGRGYDDYDDPQSRYYDREDRRRHLEHESDYWHSEPGQYHLKYVAARDAEIRERNAEIIQNLKNIYFSKKIVIIFIISIVLSILSFPLTIFLQGVIMWNILIFGLLLAFYYVTAKTKVRPEIRDRETMIRLSAQNKAFRK